MAAIDDAIHALGLLQERVQEALEAAGHSAGEADTSVQAAAAFGAADAVEICSRVKSQIDEVAGLLGAIKNQVEQARGQLITVRDR